MLEADGCNFQMHGLPGSADDLLQRIEEMRGASDKKTNYPVGALDARYAACSFDRGEVSSGRQTPHLDDLPALQIGEKSVEGPYRNELSLVHNSKAVAQYFCLLHVVRGIDNGRAGFAQMSNNVEYVLSRL